MHATDSLATQSLFGSDSDFYLLIRRTGLTLYFRVLDDKFVPSSASERRFTYYKIHSDNKMRSLSHASDVILFGRILLLIHITTTITCICFKD